eukprot:941065-Pelagomonas_calceolata.AAC.1
MEEQLLARGESAGKFTEAHMCWLGARCYAASKSVKLNEMMILRAGYTHKQACTCIASLRSSCWCICLLTAKWDRPYSRAAISSGRKELMRASEFSTILDSTLSGQYLHRALYTIWKPRQTDIKTGLSGQYLHRHTGQLPLLHKAEKEDTNECYSFQNKAATFSSSHVHTHLQVCIWPRLRKIPRPPHMRTDTHLRLAYALMTSEYVCMYVPGRSCRTSAADTASKRRGSERGLCWKMP